MITTGAQLYTLVTSLNGGSSIDIDLLDVLVDTARATIEEERPWVVLRKTDTSKTVATSSTWQTAIDLSTITDFSRFYSDSPIKLFDGTNRIDYFRLIPWDRRLEYKDVSGTATFNHNTKQLYLNGTVAFAGTLYIPYVSTATAIDLTSTSAVWTVFPSRFLPLLAYHALALHMSGTDYDTQTARMAPAQLEAMRILKNAMSTWDDGLQLSDQSISDPTDYVGGYPRAGSINRYE